ncbi:hypothetical protein Y032_0058g2898 [Ancylostoma ceylanicum]|uniref:Uncharacterized protein n=1 Tax=Ancylostoma ceylanicum TaxID=53326 RepID=A0A016U3R8_9BILA|nr:hypothetical protein Y032_0058g2898 [Ancylostoma ceylanicum]
MQNFPFKCFESQLRFFAFLYDSCTNFSLGGIEHVTSKKKDAICSKNLSNSVFCVLHFVSRQWKLIAISNWKRAKTCLACNTWRDLPYLRTPLSGKIGETVSISRNVGLSSNKSYKYFRSRHRCG